MAKTLKVKSRYKLSHPPVSPEGFLLSPSAGSVRHTPTQSKNQLCLGEGGAVVSGDPTDLLPTSIGVSHSHPGPGDCPSERAGRGYMANWKRLLFEKRVFKERISKTIIFFSPCFIATVPFEWFPFEFVRFGLFFGFFFRGTSFRSGLSIRVVFERTLISIKRRGKNKSGKICFSSDCILKIKWCSVRKSNTTMTSFSWIWMRG